MERSSSKLKMAGILILAGLLVSCALIYANGRLYNRSGTAFSGKEFKLVGELNSMSNNNSSVYFIGDMMLEIQSQVIKARNIDSTITWSERMPGVIGKVKNAGENILVADSTKVLNCLSKRGKVLWSFNLPYDCMELYTQENGTVLVEYKNSSGCRFDVLDKKGGKLGSGLVEDAYLLSFSSGDDGLFSISVLDVSSDSVKSKVLTYNYKGDIIWASNYDNEIISSIAYEKNGNLIVVGDKNLYKYKPNGKLAVKQPMKSSTVKSATDGYLTVLIANDKGEPNAVCYDGNLRKTGSIVLDETPDGIYISKNGFALYDNEELGLYDMRCNRTSAYNSPIDIIDLYMAEDNKFYLVSNRKLQLLESR